MKKYRDKSMHMPKWDYSWNGASPQPPPPSTGIACRSARSISSFMAGFKSAATKRINALRGTPKMAVWQSRYHDYIIRNDESKKRIITYIQNNPQNWKKKKNMK